MRMRFRNVKPSHDRIVECLQRVSLNEDASKEISFIARSNQCIGGTVKAECHTFYFPCEECTVTLEDAALHLGLPINWMVIIGTTNLNVPLLQDIREAWLGRRPEVKDFIG